MMHDTIGDQLASHSVDVSEDSFLDVSVSSKPAKAKPRAKKASEKPRTTRKVRRALEAKATAPVVKAAEPAATQPAVTGAEYEQRAYPAQKFHIGLVSFTMPSDHMLQEPLGDDPFRRAYIKRAGTKIELNVRGDISAFKRGLATTVIGFGVVAWNGNDLLPVRITINVPTNPVRPLVAETRMSIVGQQSLDSASPLQSWLRVDPRADLFVLLTELDEKAAQERFMRRRMKAS